VTIALRCPICRQTVEHGQDLRVRGDIPLLPPEVRPADDSIAVDDVDGGALAKRPRSTLDVVGQEDGSVLVGQDRKGKLQFVNEASAFGQAVRRDANHFCSETTERSIVVAQLREMPSAEWSTRAAQEDQHDVKPATVIGERHLAAGG
jgi:hypothetical protein